MLDVPAAKDLNAVLLDTIRMQRHSGTRVLISTQEPTLLTDLIALCSIAVIHRFSSPEWFTAIRRHIRIPETEREELMERIEALPTGTAIVYSPKSVLERRDDGTIKQGTGIMLEVKMRQRITADGGKDVFAV
jgi:DNA helicase HerA-like ATPase